MSILKWKPLDELPSIKEEVERLFDRIFEKTTFHSWEERYALMSSGVAAPQFNISHSGESVVIQANLPGFEKGEIKVCVSGNLLAIGSEVNKEREVRGSDAYGYHRSQGSFCKVMELPAGLDTNGIKTSFKNGVLEVMIPKVSSSTPSQERVATSIQPMTPPTVLTVRPDQDNKTS